MKKQHILSICIAGALLTACGSGSSGGSTNIKNKNTNIIQPNNGSNQNPINAKNKVPSHLKRAVKEALKFQVHYEHAPNYKATAVIDNKSYNKGDFIYLTDFDLGYSVHNFIDSESEYGATKGKVRIYRLPYSVITADTITYIDLATNNTHGTNSVSYGAKFYLGYPTKNLPKTGKANYTGKSFYNEEMGNLNLVADFGSKKVNGKITGLSTGDVTLKEGKIQPVKYRDGKQMGFSGEVLLANKKAFSKAAHIDSNGKRFSSEELNSSEYNFAYSGHFFGPKAEEVGGVIKAVKKDNNWEYEMFLNFAGQRGKIKK